MYCRRSSQVVGGGGGGEKFNELFINDTVDHAVARKREFFCGLSKPMRADQMLNDLILKSRWQVSPR